MMEAMPAQLFDEWRRYEQLEPFGAIQEDYRAGMICAQVVNMQRGEGDPLWPKDFFVTLRPDDDEEKVDRAAAGAKRLMQAWGS